LRKRRDDDPGRHGRERRAQANRCRSVEIGLGDVETGGSPGTSSEDVLRLAERHPACRRREARPGFRMERENLAGDGKGKGTSGSNREAEIPMRRRRADCFVVAKKRGNARGAKGAGHRHWRGPTGNGRSSMFNGRRQPSCDGTSRMTRECQVRFCERLGVQFPGPTRLVFFRLRAIGRAAPI